MIKVTGAYFPNKVDISKYQGSVNTAIAFYLTPSARADTPRKIVLFFWTTLGHLSTQHALQFEQPGPAATRFVAFLQYCRDGFACAAFLSPSGDLGIRLV